MFKNTSVRLSEKHIRRLDKLAEHLRAVTGSTTKSRSVAVSYLIEKSITDDGRPTWEAMGLGPTDLPESYQDIMSAADEPADAEDEE